jgi:hypothetical protein
MRGKDMPAFMALARNKGLASLALGMQRVEFLFEPFIGGFTRIDGAAQARGSFVGCLRIRPVWVSPKFRALETVRLQLPI